MFGIEFGEKALWRRAVVSGSRNNKLDSVWIDSVYLGHKTISGESIVGDKDGVFKSRIVRRVPVEGRWNPELLQSIGGVPWKCHPQIDEV